MPITRRILPAFIALLSVPAWATAATPCRALPSLVLPNGTLTSGQVVAKGAFVPPPAAGTAAATPTAAAPRAAAGAAPGPAAAVYARLPVFCRAQVTLRPSTDSNIAVEVWLPATGWNGKLQAVGNGGFAGVLPYGAMARALLEGYAAAGTDTGHVGNNADFVPGHPERLVDFAYRAVHEMTVAAKRIIDAHYGQAPRFSYFNGCSQGGRQAITSAQRYPEDFDGIVAGAAAWNTMRSHAARLALNFTVNRAPEAVIPPAKYRVIHDAVLKACDGLDDVKDGVIENPLECVVDLSTLACGAKDGPNCLTAPQLESANAMISPLVRPGSTEVLFPGHLMPGAELEWATLGGPRPLRFAQSAIANMVFGDKDWNAATFDAPALMSRVDAADNGLLRSDDANLAPFFARGGKLLMYHGWADPQVPPQLSTLYYTNVLRTVGPSAASSIELFMMPGVYHCAGGPGPDTFDRMAAIEAWVEHGRKPTRLVASRQVNGKRVRTRPLCPFGQLATYSGRGSTDDAASFACTVAGGTAPRPKSD